MNRNAILFLLVFVFAIAVFACVEKTDVANTEKQPAKAPMVPTTKVQRGDTVVIEFTVDTGPDMYLNGPKPVVAKVPGNTPFTFSHPEYIVTKPVFPLKIKFDVPGEAPVGLQKVDLALRLMFCKKKDDICVIKNDIHSINMEVEAARRETGVMIHTLPETYRLKD